MIASNKLYLNIFTNSQRDLLRFNGPFGWDYQLASDTTHVMCVLILWSGVIVDFERLILQKIFIVNFILIPQFLFRFARDVSVVIWTSMQHLRSVI